MLRKYIYIKKGWGLGRHDSRADTPCSLAWTVVDVSLTCPHRTMQKGDPGVETLALLCSKLGHSNARPCYHSNHVSEIICHMGQSYKMTWLFKERLWVQNGDAKIEIKI